MLLFQNAGNNPGRVELNRTVRNTGIFNVSPLLVGPPGLHKSHVSNSRVTKSPLDGAEAFEKALAISRRYIIVLKTQNPGMCRGAW